MGRHGEWGGQQPGDFLDKHATDVLGPQCGYCPCWSREQAQWGLCPSLGRPAWLSGIPPGQLGGEGQHFLSLCALGGTEGGRGALKTSAHLCTPEEGCPAGGGGGRRGSSPVPQLLPSPTVHLRVRLSGGPHWPSCSSLNRPSISLPPLRASAPTVPSARSVLPAYLPSFVPCFICLFKLSFPQRLSLTMVSECDPTPEHTSLCLFLYSLSSHKNVSCILPLAFCSLWNVPVPTTVPGTSWCLVNSC